jgi:hypothetical protein
MEDGLSVDTDRRCGRCVLLDLRFPRDGSFSPWTDDGGKSSVSRDGCNVDLVTGPVHGMGHVRKGVLRNAIDARDQTVLRFHQSHSPENCV